MRGNDQKRERQEERDWRQEEIERQEEGERGSKGDRDGGRERRGTELLAPNPAPTIRGGYLTLKGEGGGGRPTPSPHAYINESGPPLLSPVLYPHPCPHSSRRNL